MSSPGDAKVVPMPPGPRSLQSVIDSATRLDELGMSRVIEQAAELVHKAQGGQVIGTLSPKTIEVLNDGSVTLALGSATELPGYIAPERLEGKPGDRRSDVYSLGVILWEALAHARLFEGSDEAMKAMALAGAVGPPSEMNANIPAELDAICKKALARDPGDRYPSAKVFAAELGAVLEDAGYPEGNDRIVAYLGDHPAVRATQKGTDATYATYERAATPLPTATPEPTIDKAAELKASRSAMNKTMMGMPVKIDSPAVPAAAPPPPTMAAAMPKPPVLPTTPAVGRTPTPIEPAIGRTATTMGMSPQTRTSPSSTVMGISSMTHTPAPPQSASGTAMGMSAQAIAAEQPTAVPEKPARTKTPSSGVAPPPSAIPSIARTKSASVQPLPSRTKTPTLPPPPVSAARTKTASVPPPKKEDVSSTTPGLTPTLRPPADTTETKPIAPAEEAPPAEPPKADPGTRTTTMGSSSLAEALAKLNAVAQPDAEVPAAVAAVLRAETSPPVDLTKTAVDTAPPTMVETPSGRKLDPKLAAAETQPVRKLDVGEIPGATSDPAESISASVGGAMPAAGALPPEADDFAPEPDKPVLPTGTATAADPAAVVALPRRRRSTSKGDELAGWEWKSDTHEALPGDEYEDDSKQAKKKRMLIIGAAVGIVVVLALSFAVAGRGSDKKPEKKQTASSTWKDEPTPKPIAEQPVVAPTIDAAEVVPAVVTPDAAEPDAATPDAAVAVVVDAAVPDAAVAVVAKQEPVKTEPVKQVAKQEPTKPEKPIKAEQTKPTKVEATKPDKTKPEKPTKPGTGGKPVDPYAPEKSDPGVAYRQGLQQFASGDTSGALQTFKASAAMNPDHAPTWRGMGMVYEKLGNAKAAKSAYAKYLKLAPNAKDVETIRARMEKL